MPFFRFLSIVLLGIVLLALSDSGSTQKKTTPRIGSLLMASSSIQESCFTRTVLMDHLDEPMQLAIVEDGRVFFIDRHGAVRLYNPRHNTIRKINQVSVQTKYGNGLLGIILDPNFLSNRFLYLYYTPATGPLRQCLSRFIFADSIDYKSEKKILEIPWEVEMNGHTGGSMAFDEHGNLFLSVGDNTAAFVEDGYASIDERPNRQTYDAQRTAANTNDLRGKILRIHPEPDGSYTIPADNLFVTPVGRPEIYIMGCRNPYRITYDTASHTLYWGDIGPDDAKDDKHGPRGYDEINQAQEAGNYGWPYFIADNKPYRAYDFATDQFGDYFNPLAPTNKSVNNTGARQLPPARKAMIWYPYNASAEFPEVGTGGRAGMVGPVYHYKPAARKVAHIPVEYDNRLFIFDWMRNQINTVVLDKQGRYVSIEPFMPTTDFDKPIDIKFDTNGILYLLEYGEGFWVKNADASLVRIDYGTHNGAIGDTSQHYLAKRSMAESLGQKLIARNDCRNCHLMNRRTAAPSFVEIATRYHRKAGVANRLAEKVIKGGAGVWGQHAMSPHPQLEQQEAIEMVDFILSLKDVGD